MNATTNCRHNSSNTHGYLATQNPQNAGTNNVQNPATQYVQSRSACHWSDLFSQQLRPPGEPVGAPPSSVASPQKACSSCSSQVENDRT